MPLDVSINVRSIYRHQLRLTLVIKLDGTLWIAPVSKLILLLVARPKDVQSNGLDNDDDRGQDRSEVDGVEGEVTRLEAVDERYVNEIAKRQHETEAIGRDVHLVQDPRL